MSRAHLPNKRPASSFEIEHFDPLAAPAGGVGVALRFHVCIGAYSDGKPAEVFVHAMGKAGRGSMLEALARDSAVLISLAVQYGVPIELMRRAVSRDETNRPQTFVGAVLDAMEG